MAVSEIDRQRTFTWAAREIRRAGYSERMLPTKPMDLPRYEPAQARLYFGLPAGREQNPPLLLNSSETARRTVAVLKNKWQNRFVIAFMITGFMLFSVLGVLLWRNQREVLEGWAEHGGAETGTSGLRGRFFVDVGYIFLVLAAFLFGIIQLLLSIRW